MHPFSSLPVYPNQATSRSASVLLFSFVPSFSFSQPYSGLSRLSLRLSGCVLPSRLNNSVNPGPVVLLAAPLAALRAPLRRCTGLFWLLIPSVTLTPSPYSPSQQRRGNRLRRGVWPRAARLQPVPGAAAAHAVRAPQASLCSAPSWTLPLSCCWLRQGIRCCKNKLKTPSSSRDQAFQPGRVCQNRPIPCFLQGPTFILILKIKCKDIPS